MADQSERSSNEKAGSHVDVDLHRHQDTKEKADRGPEAVLTTLTPSDDGTADASAQGPTKREGDAGEQAEEVEIEYPSGFALAILTFGLCLVIFVVRLVHIRGCLFWLKVV